MMGIHSTCDAGIPRLLGSAATTSAASTNARLNVASADFSLTRRQASSGASHDGVADVGCERSGPDTLTIEPSSARVVAGRARASSTAIEPPCAKPKRWIDRSGQSSVRRWSNSAVRRRRDALGSGFGVTVIVSGRVIKAERTVARQGVKARRPHEAVEERDLQRSAQRQDGRLWQCERLAELEEWARGIADPVQ